MLVSLYVIEQAVNEILKSIRFAVVEALAHQQRDSPSCDILQREAFELKTLVTGS